jgi:hypothetical protein
VSCERHSRAANPDEQAGKYALGFRLLLGALDVELSPDEVAWHNLELAPAAGTVSRSKTILD